MSFAAGLSKKVAAKKVESTKREQLGKEWLNYEDSLLDEVLEIFKARCTRAAGNCQCTHSASFEILTREVPKFPTYQCKDKKYLVNSWGDGNAAGWYYAHVGCSENFTSGTEVQFAEVLEGMMEKFIAKVRTLGFETCKREQGTWIVRVTWRSPDDDDVEQARQSLGKNERNASSPPSKGKAAPSPVRGVKPKRAPKRPRSGGSSSASRTEVPSETEDGATSEVERK